MKGTQRRLVCPQCGKVFFAWRPDDLPGAKVKCYFCGHQFEDDAARRPPLPPPAPVPVSVPAPSPDSVPAPSPESVPAPATNPAPAEPKPN